MSFIGIDLGTSYIKGAVLDLETSRLEHIQRVPFPNRLSKRNPLLFEFSPHEIATTTRRVIDSLAQNVSTCEGIVMCSQMHGMILLDEQGELASNFISWMDHRGLMDHPSGSGSYLDVLMGRTTATQRKQVGNELGLERPACFLFYLSERGELRNSGTAVSISEYVLSALCDSEPSGEMTNASASGLFDLEAQRWHQELIEAIGLATLRFPALRALGEVVGYLTVGSRQLPCFTAIGDHQSALLGSLLTPEELSLNISTGAQISRLTSELRLGEYQTRPFFEGQFINTFSDVPGGRSLEVLVNLLTEFAGTQGHSTMRDPWNLLEAAAMEIGDTDLEVESSFFTSLNSGGGRILNIRGDNLTAGSLFRATLKRMAAIYHGFACSLWPEVAWKNLVFSGGLALKLKILRDIIQQEFEVDSRLCPVAEDTLFGLLILARVFSGRSPSIQDAVKSIRCETTQTSVG
jgi:sedoheptulokinase